MLTGVDLVVEFKVQDCWIGAYWKRSARRFDLWICVVPMLPIRISFLWGENAH